MAFNIETIREELGEEKFADLKTYIADLTGQRDTAREESIAHRKGLKSEVERLTAFQNKVLERLGLETAEAFDEFDPAKAASAETSKIYEGRIRRLENELKAKADDFSGLESKHRATLLDASLAKSMADFDFVDRDLVGSFVKARVEFDGDSILYRSDDGAMIPLDQGIKTLAATKPHLVKSTGAAGSGYTPKAGAKGSKSFADLSLTERGELYRKDPQAYAAGMAELNSMKG